MTEKEFKTLRVDQIVYEIKGEHPGEPLKVIKVNLVRGVPVSVSAVTNDGIVKKYSDWKISLAPPTSRPNDWKAVIKKTIALDDFQIAKICEAGSVVGDETTDLYSAALLGDQEAINKREVLSLKREALFEFARAVRDLRDNYNI